MSDVGKSNDPAEWQFYYFRVWREDLEHGIRGAEALDRFKEKSKRLCEPFRSAAEWVPKGSVCAIDQLRYWIPEPWDNCQGRVTLAGDAAHVMMPCKSSALAQTMYDARLLSQVTYTKTVRGQGFNHSMEDALKLVETIVRIRDGADRAQVMGEYDKDVYERGRQAVLASVEEGQRNMNYEKLLTSKTVKAGFAREYETLKAVKVETV